MARPWDGIGDDRLGGEGGSRSPGEYGGSYDPVTDTWSAVSTTNAPSQRQFNTAVWTGSRMIIWGGLVGASGTNTGGVYDPATDTWTATSTANAPSPLTSFL